MAQIHREEVLREATWNHSSLGQSGENFIYTLLPIISSSLVRVSLLSCNPLTFCFLYPALYLAKGTEARLYAHWGHTSSETGNCERTPGGSLVTWPWRLALGVNHYGWTLLQKRSPEMHRWQRCWGQTSGRLTRTERHGWALNSGLDRAAFAPSKSTGLWFKILTVGLMICGRLNSKLAEVWNLKLPRAPLLCFPP